MIPPPSVIYNLFKMFRYEFLSATGIKLIADFLHFVNPFLLRLVYFWNLGEQKKNAALLKFFSLGGRDCDFLDGLFDGPDFIFSANY